MKKITRISLFSILMLHTAMQPLWAQDALNIDDKGRIGIGCTPHSDFNLTIGNLNGKKAIGIENDAIFSAKNKNHVYENYFIPRDLNDMMRLNYGKAGLTISNNDNSSVMQITPDGNVSIGATSPVLNKLQLGGNLHMDGNTIFFRGGNPTDQYDYVRWNATDDKMYIAGWSGVVIGYTGDTRQKMTPIIIADNSTRTPKMHVMGDIYARIQPDNNYDSIHIIRYTGKRRMGLLSGDFAGMELETERYSCGNGGIIKFYTWGCNAANSREVMRINERGFVGIGTTNPDAPIEIRSNVGYSVRGFGFLDPTGMTGLYEGSQDRRMSILTSGDICTNNNFMAYSDMRIKKNLVRSDAAKDLATLNQLQVTDFKYIDTVQHGSKYKKGFIAQEVEKVFPEAVSTGHDFIPNIYSAPEKIKTGNGAAIFTMSKPHHLKNGDVVRIYTSAGATEKEVTVTGDRIFSITDTAAGHSFTDAFVFGKEVHDFRMVDYDRLFTLNVSATQELAKEVAALKAENEQLKKQNAAHEAELVKSGEALTGVLARLDALEANSSTTKKITKR